MAQTVTSARTSVNSSKLPAVYGKIKALHPFVFDYGCGKHVAHIREHVDSMNAFYMPFDPYNQPNAVNKPSLKMLMKCIQYKKPVDVICSNVLNVIDDDDTVRKIAEHIMHIVNSTGGTGYVTVYEGDRSGIARYTGADSYQRNAPLRSYLPLFHNATIEHNMIVIRREC